MKFRQQYVGNGCTLVLAPSGDYGLIRLHDRSSWGWCLRDKSHRPICGMAPGEERYSVTKRDARWRIEQALEKDRGKYPRSVSSPAGRRAS